VGVIGAVLPVNHLARLCSALRAHHDVVGVDDYAMLFRVCLERPVRVAVVDFFAGGYPHFEDVRLLKQRIPNVAVIAYVAFASDRIHDLFDAGRQSVDGLVVAGMDDTPAALLAVVEQAESRGLARLLRSRLHDADPVVVDAVLLSVTRAHERLTPARLATVLGLPRRTMADRFAHAGFPPPQRLLTWGRLIAAAHLMEDVGRNADRVAMNLDFPSGSAFRNTCQRYLHTTPTGIRRQGGARFVMERFFTEVQAAQAIGPSRDLGLAR
jgi:AraC-like DNA-binding protein